MNHKLKRKWCASLRGGAYKQCYGVAKFGDKRCAVGVLYEIEPQAFLKFELWADSRDEAAELAHNVIKLNDREMKTFSEIADWIEANVPETPDTNFCVQPNFLCNL